MGRRNESKPVTAEDKVISRRHIAHREAVAKIKDRRQQLIASNRYNQTHAAEHTKQYKKNVKALAKLDKTQRKLSHA
jgi:hypothetical protein